MHKDEEIVCALKIVLYTGVMGNDPETKYKKKMLEGLERLYGELKLLKERQDREYTALNKEILFLFKRISRTLPADRILSPDQMLEDDLYHEAYSLVVKAGMASTAYLQRMLGISYARSARLMEMLEKNGVISSAIDGKPREVLLSRQAQQILKSIEEQLRKGKKKK
jgi:DNA segregation ATPase FtsK/SpoIIIE-like protein